mmetsp:Transcript_4618/g.11476  ORF Transcript_4618/g.11476 Transcript_4618/m.11476 type:complete len:395 (-) Transcript_4618:284-1468(-)
MPIMVGSAITSTGRLMIFILLSAALSVSEASTGLALDVLADHSPRWQLSWQPGVTTPPRRLVPVRWNYMSSRGGVWSPESVGAGGFQTDTCKPWLQCVHENKLEHTLHLTPWPPGTKVLFLGNSYVKELSSTAVLDVPDGAIRSMHYPVSKCRCPSPGPNSHCPLGDFLSLPPEHEKAGLRVNGVQYCDSWAYDRAVTARYNDTARQRLCADGPGVVRLYDGTMLANIVNHHYVLEDGVLPLEDGVRRAIGVPLGAFDVVVANQGNSVESYLRAPCPGGSLQHRPRNSRGLPAGSILSALERSGFRGHLFMVSDTMWQPVPSEVRQALQEAEAAGLPFSANTSSVLHGEQYEVVSVCGMANARDNHACIPGPTLWMMEALRAEYMALAVAREEL